MLETSSCGFSFSIQFGLAAVGRSGAQPHVGAEVAESETISAENIVSFPDSPSKTGGKCRQHDPNASPSQVRVSFSEDIRLDLSYAPFPNLTSSGEL